VKYIKAIVMEFGQDKKNNVRDPQAFFFVHLN
jgi:hypothetical protein